MLRLPYVGLVGGVLAVPLDQFLRVNGFSNMFWGWGAEDDDFFERSALLALSFKRYRLDGLNTLLYHLKKKTLASLGTLVQLDKQGLPDSENTPLLHLLIEVTRRSSRHPRGL
ncbi:unnamed protein product [Dibothriocephalus latus]|uniref:Galactosyltransferase C-terminal domain-containing protein n=1 Tax=Dibothriocephalus latus TaxID=60516 RepID=A0A3P7PE05_DIBLA|nr:unnamed protein product [Dibothriocephalus latus]